MRGCRWALLQAATSVMLVWPAAGQDARPGSPAPAIDLMSLDGGRVRLADYLGHAVIVTFWASWCPSCRDEFPALAAVSRRHADGGLVVLAVNERDQELRESDIRKFLAEVPVPFTVLIDRRGVSRRAYRLVGLPTTVFIDNAGVIRKVLWGPQPPGELDRAIALILAPQTQRDPGSP